MILLWISVILCAFAIGFFFYKFYQFKKARDLTNITKPFLLVCIECLAFFTIFSVTAGFGIKLWNNFVMDGGHIAMLIFGSFIFGVSFMSLIETFVIYFYKTNLDNKTRKIIRTIMYISIPLAIIFFILSLDSYAPYSNFPLISGLSFTSEGIQFGIKGYPAQAGGFTINWYGIIILTGAVVAYFISDHHFYQEYKRHGIIDTLFILVFLIGIVGARFWYCFVLEPGTKFFEFQSGGLAIMGGVIFGGTAGILFLIFFRRYINLRHAMDLILPCVLVAQAIGRWGNFFNCEVHGNPVSINAFSWLPSFILNQLHYSSVGPALGVDSIYLPLFFIEFITNLAGYFIIVYGVGKGLKKHISLGDLFCLYIVWYGLTRVILEPLRYGGYEYNNSLITAWIMFGGGLAGILGLHLYDYFRWGKRTFVIKDDSRLHNPKNPYYIKPVEVNNNEIVKN